MARVNFTEEELFFLIAEIENVLESDYDEQLASIQDNLEEVYYGENNNNNNNNPFYPRNRNRNSNSNNNNTRSSVATNNTMYVGSRRANEEGNLFPGNNRAEGNRRRRRKNRRTKKNN